MSNTDQAQEPSMEEILASIRKIISDDDGGEQTEASDDAGMDDDVAEATPAEPDSVVGEPQDEITDEAPESEPEMDMSDDLMAEISSDFDVDEALSETSDDNDEIVEEFESVRDQDEGLDDEVFELTEEIEVDEAGATEVADTETETAEISDDTALNPEDLMESRDDDDVVFAEDHEDKREDTPVVADLAAESEMAEPLPEALLSEDTGESVASSFGALENLVMSTQSRTIEDLLQSILRPMLREWLDGNLPPLVERLVREEIERVSRGRR